MRIDLLAMGRCRVCVSLIISNPTLTVLICTTLIYGLYVETESRCTIKRPQTGLNVSIRFIAETGSAAGGILVTARNADKSLIQPQN